MRRPWTLVCVEEKSQLWPEPAFALSCEKRLFEAVYPQRPSAVAGSFWEHLLLPMSLTSELWLPTTAASQALGRSPSYLKRLRDTHGGFLEAGRHYAMAPSSNAAITWNVSLIREALNKRASSFRKEVSNDR